MIGEGLSKAAADFFDMRRGRADDEVLRQRIEDSARIDGIHVLQLIAAMLIASIGLNIDSTEAVIGAMMICPLMGTVLAIAWSVATVDVSMLRVSFSQLLLQMVTCLVTSTLYFTISPLSHQTSELLANSSATVWDLIIALVGGFAGALGTSRKETPSTLVAGVAVATALMPPLCTVGFGIALRDIGLALSALYEFGVNVVFIAFGAELVLVALSVPVKRDLDGDGIVTDAELAASAREQHQLRQRLVVASLVFAIPCVIFSARVVQKSLEQNGTVFEVTDTYDTELTTGELALVCPGFSSYRVGTEDSYDLDEQMLTRRVVATIETKRELTDEEQERLDELVRLHVENLDYVTFTVAEPEQTASED